ncbi:MAG TPA: hypothetical protein VGF90_05525 [Verrucomicrobiae bacterium]
MASSHVSDKFPLGFGERHKAKSDAQRVLSWRESFLKLTLQQPAR